jgi:hypothetical protein
VNVKERILAIRIGEKAKNHKEFAEKILFINESVNKKKPQISNKDILLIKDREN